MLASIWYTGLNGLVTIRFMVFPIFLYQALVINPAATLFSQAPPRPRFFNFPNSVVILILFRQYPSFPPLLSYNYTAFVITRQMIRFSTTIRYKIRIILRRKAAKFDLLRHHLNRARFRELEKNKEREPTKKNLINNSASYFEGKKKEKNEKGESRAEDKSTRISRYRKPIFGRFLLRSSRWS